MQDFAVDAVGAPPRAEATKAKPQAAAGAQKHHHEDARVRHGRERERSREQHPPHQVSAAVKAQALPVALGKLRAAAQVGRVEVEVDVAPGLALRNVFAAQPAPVGLAAGAL